MAPGSQSEFVVLFSASFFSLYSLAALQTNLKFPWLLLLLLLLLELKIQQSVLRYQTGFPGSTKYDLYGVFPTFFWCLLTVKHTWLATTLHPSTVICLTMLLVVTTKKGLGLYLLEGIKSHLKNCLEIAYRQRTGTSSCTICFLCYADSI